MCEITCEQAFFSSIAEDSLYDICGGNVSDGVVTAIEGASTMLGGVALLNAATGMTATTVVPALCMLGVGLTGVTAAVCGAVVVGYGVYQIIT